MAIRSDDITLLLPTFAARVAELMSRMRVAGYHPVLFDGIRSFEEAAKNAKKGTGVALSIHCYGAAADIVCALHYWDCRKHGCCFYEVLGSESGVMGFVWGGKFKSVDQPHVQGISIAQQKAMRALGAGEDSIASRDAMVKAHFLRVDADQAVGVGQKSP